MLKDLSSYIRYELLRLVQGFRPADALNFFIYDTIKIFLLLTAVIFIVSVIRSLVTYKLLFIRQDAFCARTRRRSRG